MLNGWYVYGGRRTLDTETFPREIVKIRNMAAVRDAVVWSLAQGPRRHAGRRAHRRALHAADRLWHQAALRAARSSSILPPRKASPR